MHLEFSITVWPVVSLLLWLMLSAICTCFVGGCLSWAYHAAGTKEWGILTMVIICGLVFWVLLIGTSYIAVGWIEITLGY